MCTPYELPMVSTIVSLPSAMPSVHVRMHGFWIRNQIPIMPLLLASALETWHHDLRLSLQQLESQVPAVCDLVQS